MNRKNLIATAEHRRLVAHRDWRANWRKWGPYLSERAWGTVREDYSASGNAWSYFPHEHARARAYRWNEDGLMGISDRYQYLCFALALWNGRDPFLKERLFGLTNPQGNHGEDVKELYYYLDNTPTHSYMRMLYKYPQQPFPYEQLLAINAERSRRQPEYELLDTGVFDGGRYFDVTIEYAKASPEDILIQITVANRGPDAACLALLPTLWYRNTWSWGYRHGPMHDVGDKPRLWLQDGVIRGEHAVLAHTYLAAAQSADAVLFTENNSNLQHLFGAENETPAVKDAFHRVLVDGEAGAVAQDGQGTKAAFQYALQLAPGGQQTLRLRLTSRLGPQPFVDFDSLLQQRKDEADGFYKAVQAPGLSADQKLVQRQAWAGMLWSKQLYYYDIPQWLHGDPGQPSPPPAHRNGRNSGWTHLFNFDIISMPDKWEYPWYASWDLGFHCLPLALIDPDYAKRQLELFTREWYMHPNGQLPAYEWALDDVNPPVHAWAVWQVYQIDRQVNGRYDRSWLEGVFHKLLLNFTWWVNRKDADGNNIFEGGFLGMDNIGVFDRSAGAPIDAHLDQADGTAWMAFYCLTMLEIALELAAAEPIYQDSATKFFEHFLRIANAITHSGPYSNYSLWDEEDGFFYDALLRKDDKNIPLRIRSLVGLLPLAAVAVIEPEQMTAMNTFTRRMRWLRRHRPVITANIEERENHVLLSILHRDHLRQTLRYMLDEEEFLSPYGIRSLSKFHEEHVYSIELGGKRHTVGYEPGEAQTGLFGGNSNWRGPVWLPINTLLIDALRRYHRYYGDQFKVACPTGSNNMLTLAEVADELSRRICALFLLDEKEGRPYNGEAAIYTQPGWRDLLLFYEYFNGDDGTGLGAAHQTGWTGLVANLLQQSADQLDG